MTWVLVEGRRVWREPEHDEALRRAVKAEAERDDAVSLNRLVLDQRDRFEAERDEALAALDRADRLIRYALHLRINGERARSLDDVLRENLRRIRTDLGWRQADLAERMHSRAGWNASSVAWVENGRRKISAPELVWLCEVLGVAVGDLLAGTAYIGLEGADYAVPLVMLRNQATGTGPGRRGPEKLTASDSAARDDERKVAKRLDLSPATFRSVVYATYGRHFTEERDRRVGDVEGLSARTVQAKRGHATRGIVAELAALIDEHGIENVKREWFERAVKAEKALHGTYTECSCGDYDYPCDTLRAIDGSET